MRRVEALVGLDAFRYLAREHVLVNQLAGEFKAQPEELPERIAGVLDRLKSAERELDQLRAAQVLASAGALAAAAEQRRRGPVRRRRGAGRGGRQRPARARARRARPAAPGRPGRRPARLAERRRRRGVRRRGEPGRVRRPGSTPASWCARSRPVLGARGGGKADLAQGAGGDAAKLADAFAAVTGRRR